MGYKCLSNKQDKVCNLCFPFYLVRNFREERFNFLKLSFVFIFFPQNVLCLSRLGSPGETVVPRKEAFTLCKLAFAVSTHFVGQERSVFHY